jgi:hypothetical protein
MATAMPAFAQNPSASCTTHAKPAEQTSTYEELSKKITEELASIQASDQDYERTEKTALVKLKAQMKPTDDDKKRQSYTSQLNGILNDKLAARIAAELAKIPSCKPTQNDLDKRKKLLELQTELKSNGPCADLQSISDQLDKILVPNTLMSGAMSGRSPFDTPSTKKGENSITIGLNGSDSFNREVGATAKIQYNFGNQPDGGTFHEKLTSNFYCTDCNEYIFNINANYDDRWKAAPSKPGAANYSNVTQQYSGEVLQLSNLFHAHTVISGSAYHDNSQGVLYDVEPGIGVFFRWPGNPKPSQPANYQAILGLAGQADIDMQYTDAHATTLGGLHTYLLLRYGTNQEAKNTIGFNLRGFLPAIETAANGHASAIVTDDFAITRDKQWSLSFSILDSYYSTVPTSYSHNSLTPSISIKFTAQAKK